MWNLFPKFNHLTPNNVWRANNKVNVLPALVMNALLTERADEQNLEANSVTNFEAKRKGFWGAPDFGSVIYQQFYTGISAHDSVFRVIIADKESTGNQQAVQIVKHISESLKFLQEKSLAKNIDIRVEARRGTYRITLHIDEDLLEI